MIAVVLTTVLLVSSASMAQHSPAHGTADPSPTPSAPRTSPSGKRSPSPGRPPTPPPHRPTPGVNSQGQPYRDSDPDVRQLGQPAGPRNVPPPADGQPGPG